MELYNDSKYTKWYFSIISNVQKQNRRRKKSNDPTFVYYEAHHIIPACLGGERKKHNLVLLTAKEHFICHRLLVKMVKEKKHYFQMLNALVRFTHDNGLHKRNYTARHFAIMRAAASENNRNNPRIQKICKEFGEKYGGTNPITPEIVQSAVLSRQRKLEDPEYKKWLSNIMSNRDFSWITPEWRENRSKQYKALYKERPEIQARLTRNGERNGMYGKKHKQSTKRLIGKSNKGKLAGDKNPMYNKTHNSEARAKIAKAKKGTKCIFDPLTYQQKMVDASRVEEYVARGWKLGRPKRTGEPDFLLSF